MDSRDLTDAHLSEAAGLRGEPYGIAFQTSDPDHLVEALRPVAPGVSIRATARERFGAEVLAYRLPRLGLFTIALGSANVLSPDPRRYVGVTVPLDGPFWICERGRVETFVSGSAHILNAGEPFDFRTAKQARVLVANFDAAWLEEHARRFDARGDWGGRFASTLSTATREGASVLRFLQHVWREIQREGSTLHSSFAAREVEDALAAILVQASLGTLHSLADEHSNETGTGYLGRAEEYLMAHLSAPVSLAEVAEASGVCVRTLSRAFRKRHGLGPMGFLRHRRLEATRHDLLVAERDGMSVTEVALRYGFRHLGRFAVDYRQAFGESPSETLRR